MKLSIVIPCYNEAKNLPLLFSRCAELINIPGVEIIFVDNGSTDSSKEVFKKLLPSYPNFRIIRVPVNQGYGYGILSGLKAASGEFLAWTHADMQTDPKDIIRGLEMIKFKKDQSIYIKGLRINRPYWDLFFTISMSLFESLLFRTKFWDINAQPNIIHKNFYLSWENAPHDFSLDLYVYCMAQMRGLRIYRFPVEFGRRAHGVSSWNINWISKINFIRRTIHYSFMLKKRL